MKLMRITTMEMENKLKTYVLGTYAFIPDLDKSLIISDPAYGIDETLNITIPNLKPGKYSVWLNTKISPFDKNFWLNAFVGFSHESEIVGFENGILTDEEWLNLGKAPVDSGSLGIFVKYGFNTTRDTVQTYRDWYSQIKYVEPYFLGNTIDVNNKVIPCLQEKLQFTYNEQSSGVIFSTNGDGFYDIYGKSVNGEITKFFIALSNVKQSYETYEMFFNANFQF